VWSVRRGDTIGALTTVALVAPALVYLLGVFYYPLGKLVSLSFYDPHLTLKYYLRIVSVAAYRDLVWTTLRIALVTTGIAIVLAYPVAYVLTTLRGRFYRLAMFIVLLPLWTSALIRAYAWLVLLGRNGVVNNVLTAAGLITQPLQLVFNSFGVYVGMVQILLPYAILPIHASMRNIDAALLRAGNSLGATPITGFLTIFLPLSMGGVFAAGLLVFILAFGSFIIPSLLGGLRETMIAVYVQNEIGERLNWGFGAALSVVMLVLVIIAAAASWRLTNPTGFISSSNPGALEGRPASRRGLVRGWRPGVRGWLIGALNVVAAAVTRVAAPARRFNAGPILLWTAAGVVGAYLVLPALVILPVSFSSTQYLTFPPQGFSLHYYQLFFTTDRWTAAVALSLRVAAVVVVVAMVLGAGAAYALIRRRPRYSGLLYLVLVLPTVVPSIAYAVGYYYLATRAGIVGTPLGLICAHVALAIPFVVITLSATLNGLSPDFERASASLGASPLRTFRHILWPLMLPGLLASALFAFLVSFDELIVAIFVTGLHATLPKMLWDGIRFELNPIVAAVSSLLIFLSALLVLAAEIAGPRGRRIGEGG
jgi:putative spermidine/putrescine transport system permease protein